MPRCPGRPTRPGLPESAAEFHRLDQAAALLSPPCADLIRTNPSAAAFRPSPSWRCEPGAAQKGRAMKQAFDATARGLRTFVSDVADGFFEITHNGFALVGLAIVFAVLALAARPDLRQIRRRTAHGLAAVAQAAARGMTDLEPDRHRPHHGREPARPAQAAGRRRLLAEQEVPRGARAAERAGGRSLRARQAHQARPDADPGRSWRSNPASTRSPRARSAPRA